MPEPAKWQQARYVSFWFPWKVKLRYTIIYPDSNASRSKAAMHSRSKAAHSSSKY
jgi:hypothetical protein